MKKTIAWLMLVAAVAPRVALADALEDYDPPETGSVRIVRDTFGVPHIIARDEPSLYYGVGRAQAEDQLENLAINFLRAAGRAAEREGRAALPMDRMVRALQLDARGRDQYEKLSPDLRAQLDAFARGVNDYREQNADRVPDWIEPIEPYQVLSFSNFVEMAFCVGHARGDLGRAGLRIADLGLPTEEDATWFGSNQFAVSPKRSATGNAQLSMDPHLLLSGFYRWYEMHLVGPDLNVMGACFFGTPYVSMGRTARSAWCMTVNGPDLGDVFAFEIDPDDPSRYRDVDGWKTFETHDETCLVRDGDKVEEINFTVRQTTLGPVMAERDGVAYAFCLPWAESPDRVQQISEMARAKNLEEFKEALSSLGIVMFNIVYADVDGDIFYVSNGRVPRRDERISSRDIRPGHEAWARWQGYHPLDELPQVTNPPAGFVMNTNSGPGSVTLEVAPQAKDYPSYMMSQSPNSRSRRLRQLLEADESISWDEMRRYAADTYLIHADEWAPKLVAAARQAAEARPSDAELLGEVADVLNDWDRRADLDSKGTVLYVLLMVDGSWSEPLEKEDWDSFGQRIARAAGQVRRQFGSLDVAWGEFSKLRRGDIVMGVAGVGHRDSKLGSMTALRPTYGLIASGARYASGGSSYGMVVDFAGATQAVSCLPFGISDNPESPHFADQMPIYCRGEFKPAWFFPEELKANAASEQTIVVPTRGG